MKYIIQETDRTPPILNCISRSENDIAAGVYPYNTKLPSKRIIANEVGVSTITVEHAYALLCDEGYVQSKERSRYFVIFRIDDGFCHFFGQKNTASSTYTYRYKRRISLLHFNKNDAKCPIWENLSLRGHQTRGVPS